MTKREAQRIALRLAYNAIEKAVGTGGEEGSTYEDQLKIDHALSDIAQRMFERAEKAEAADTATPEGAA